MLECANAAARRLYRTLAAQTREAMESTGRLIVPSTQDWQEGWAAYEHDNTTSAGIVDQVSFVVMRRLGITEVFTNDRHFKAAGFKTLF